MLSFWLSVILVYCVVIDTQYIVYHDSDSLLPNMACIKVKILRISTTDSGMVFSNGLDHEVI